MCTVKGGVKATLTAYDADLGHTWDANHASACGEHAGCHLVAMGALGCDVGLQQGLLHRWRHRGSRLQYVRAKKTVKCTIYRRVFVSAS